MALSFDPGVVITLVVAEVLYLRAIRVLRGRGVTVPRWQQACFHGAVALWVIGLMSPVDTLGAELLSAHMAQHLLIADLAAPLLLVGIRNPVLMFLLPRPALVTLARRDRLRSAFRTLRTPLVAVPLYVLVLYFWHLSFSFEAAVRHDAVHALQHASFIAIGVLVWWSLLEPKRRRLRGGLWKIPHILSARLMGMFLGMAFILIQVPVYADVYGSGDRGHGLTAVADQQLAGGMMMVLDLLIMVGALCFFFLRAGQEHDRGEARAAEAAAARASRPASRAT